MVRHWWPTGLGEWTAVAGFFLLTLFLISDPIGRRAVQSYETAVDEFIEQRSITRQNFVSLPESKLDKVSETSTLKVRDEEAGGIVLIPSSEFSGPALDLPGSLEIPVAMDARPPEQSKPVPGGTIADIIPRDRDGSIFSTDGSCSQTDALAGLCRRPEDTFIVPNRRR